MIKFGYLLSMSSRFLPFRFCHFDEAIVNSLKLFISLLGFMVHLDSFAMVNRHIVIHMTVHYVRICDIFDIFMCHWNLPFSIFRKTRDISNQSKNIL